MSDEDGARGGRQAINEVWLWLALVIMVGATCFVGGYVLAEHRNEVAARGIWVVESEPPAKQVTGSTYQTAGDGQTSQPGRTQPGTDSISVGRSFPSLSFTATSGRRVDIASLKGKVVLVHFWATWCPFCTKEMPDLVSAYRKFHGKGFEIVGVSLDNDQQKLQSYLSENNIAWPQYFDGKGWGSEPARRFGIHVVPTYVLLDRGGVVIDMALKGPMLESKLTAMLSGDKAQVASAEAELARIENITNVTERGSRVADYEGNWMEIASVEPNSPAVLKPGEKMFVRIKYHLVTDKPVQIWAMPGGASTRHYKYCASKRIYRSTAATDTIERYFLYDGPASVSELRVNMKDSESRKDMMTLEYDCSARWEVPAGQVEKMPEAPAPATTARLTKTPRPSVWVTPPRPSVESLSSRSGRAKAPWVEQRPPAGPKCLTRYGIYRYPPLVESWQVLPQKLAGCEGCVVGDAFASKPTRRVAPQGPYSVVGDANALGKRGNK